MASISRRPSHCPAKFSANAAAFGCFSIRSTWPRSASGCESRPFSARASNSASGIVLQRKYDSRAASAKSSSLPGFSRRDRKSGDTRIAVRPTRTACSKENSAASSFFTSSTNGFTSAAVPIRLVAEVGRKFVRAEAALRFLARVAVLTMLHQKRAKRMIRLRRNRRLRRTASAEENREEQRSRKRHDFHEPESGWMWERERRTVGQVGHYDPAQAGCPALKTRTAPR